MEASYTHCGNIYTSFLHSFLLWEVTTQASTSLYTICRRLNGLQDLSQAPYMLYVIPDFAILCMQASYTLYGSENEQNLENFFKPPYMLWSKQRTHRTFISPLHAFQYSKQTLQTPTSFLHSWCLWKVTNKTSTSLPYTLRKAKQTHELLSTLLHALLQSKLTVPISKSLVHALYKSSLIHDLQKWWSL